MLYRNSHSLFLFRLLGVSCVFYSLFSVLGVLSTYLLGEISTPAWFYSLIWPNATQFLVAAIVCSLLGAVCLLFPAQIPPMEGAAYELW